MAAPRISIEREFDLIQEVFYSYGRIIEYNNGWERRFILRYIEYCQSLSNYEPPILVDAREPWDVDIVTGDVNP
jgi:hypothetical protein